MLIRFTAENYRSINEEVVFSLLPGKAQKHSNHIITHPTLGIDALRIALLYGANASGKSNLVRAMAFAQEFIIDGTHPKATIPVQPFRLDKTRPLQPSRFEFEFITNGQGYAYGFSVDRQRVHDEWLYLVNAKDETSLFERETNKQNKVKATFNPAQITDPAEQQFLQFVVRGTRPNQLLLTSLIENNVQLFEAAYEWFYEKLRIIFPKSKYLTIPLDIHKDQKLSKNLASFLYAMNTGIDEVCTERVDLDSLDIPKDMLIEKFKELDEDHEAEEIERILVANTPRGRYLLVLNQMKEVVFYSLNTRRFVNGETVDFDIFEESDGTQRLFDLFPILYDTSNRVFVVDELERSLHPNLVRNFLQTFLTTENKSQLIVTTHEATLLDLELLRRDEIWFAEKSPAGASSFYSLEEFKPRHDLDIRKGYLQGRFGAIPVFGSTITSNPVES